MIKFLVFTLIFLFNFSAFSQINTEENPSEYSLANKYFSKDLSVFEPKKPTPSRFFTSSLSMPDEFFTSNNLAKKPGSFYRAFGEIIFVQGTITDSFGVPIHNAVVEIWQANAAGKYHTLLEPNSKFIDKYYRVALDSGAIGGKILGAGSGGFLMFYTNNKEKLRKKMIQNGLEEVRFGFDFQGARIVLS